MRTASPILFIGLFLFIPATLRSEDSDPLPDPQFTLAEDVIYGRKWGTALTMDVFSPQENSNGCGLILVLSSGWMSDKGAIGRAFNRELLRRGYTVFEVAHGSQPRFTIPEILEDLHRAVRFIRHHAADYRIDPEHLGIYGRSAGGHLSLMQGVAGQPGNPEDKDPVNRHSSRVQAVAAFFPPTDFLNYGQPGETALGTGLLKNFTAPFAFQQFDNELKAFVPITDPERRLEIGRQISPANHVDSADPPTILFHGDQDRVVPLQQSRLIGEKLRDAGVPSRLIIHPGEKHGWKNVEADLILVADWFDQYLLQQPAK